MVYFPKQNGLTYIFSVCVILLSIPLDEKYRICPNSYSGLMNYICDIIRNKLLLIQRRQVKQYKILQAAKQVTTFMLTGSILSQRILSLI